MGITAPAVTGQNISPLPQDSRMLRCRPRCYRGNADFLVPIPAGILWYCHHYRTRAKLITTVLHRIGHRLISTDNYEWFKKNSGLQLCNTSNVHQNTIPEYQIKYQIKNAKYISAKYQQIFPKCSTKSLSKHSQHAKQVCYSNIKAY